MIKKKEPKYKIGDTFMLLDGQVIIIIALPSRITPYYEDKYRNYWTEKYLNKYASQLDKRVIWKGEYYV